MFGIFSASEAFLFIILFTVFRWSSGVISQYESGALGNSLVISISSCIHLELELTLFGSSHTLLQNSSTS